MKFCAVLVLFVSACETPTTVEKPTEKPRKTFDVFIEPGDATTFHIARNGQPGYGRDPTRVVTNGRETIVPLGSKAAFPVGLSNDRLFRVEIGTTAYLISPSRPSSLMDNPCFGWEIGAEHFDANTDDKALARCVEKGAECPPGFLSYHGPRLASDPLCANPDADESQRCVKPATISWDGSGSVSFEAFGGTPEPMPGPIELLPDSCGFSYVISATDKVGIVVGVGEAWTLSLDENDQIVGRR